MYTLQLTCEELELLKGSIKKQLASVQIDAETFERQVDRQTCTNYFSKNYIQLRRESYQHQQLELSDFLSRLNTTII